MCVYVFDNCFSLSLPDFLAGREVASMRPDLFREAAQEADSSTAFLNILFGC